MHHHHLLIFFALLIFCFGLVSKLAERKYVTGPMVFMTVGIVGSSLGLDLFDVHYRMEPVKLVAELALTLILFIDATLIQRGFFKTDPAKIAMRLLFIALPLSMLLGTGIGVLLLGSVGLVSIILLALILSPTDAALGQAVIKSESVPDGIRQAISVESGLNDGFALPPILICMAILGAEAAQHDAGWGMFVVKQLTLGPVVGFAVGWCGGWLVDRVSSRGWMEETFQRLSALPLAILAFAAAEIVGGNGFISAFVAGLGLTIAVASDHVRHNIQEFGETEGVQLMLIVFLLFGMVMVPVAANYWGAAEVAYALLSLTVIRMVPVAISMLGSGHGRNTILFIGWFGPRGIASVLYLLMAVAALGFEGYERIMSVIVLTIMISVFAHGISAVPLSERFGRSLSRQ